jgi:hypothetical protein
MLHRVTLIRTNVFEESIAYIIGVIRLLLTDNIVPS